MYKITFDMRSPIIFTELPTFDGLLSYCYAREHVKDWVQRTNLSKKDIEFLENMPLKKFPNGAFVASWLQCEKARNAEYITSLKKRWANEYDHMAEFGTKVMRRVHLSTGEYKSYQIPFQLNNIDKVWFYFDTDDLKEVNRLLLTHLMGIGKKISAGYGEFREWVIEQIDYDPFADTILRPMPSGSEGVFMAWKPPYWLPENMAFCSI